MSRQHKQPTRKRDDTRETDAPPANDELTVLSRRHLRFGWWSLLLFLSLGIGLEALHGLKVGWYLDIAHTTRREMWTLAHAHGTLLAVLNLILGTTLRLRPPWRPRNHRTASACLLSAGLLLPAGFFLGGLRAYEGDPGVGIILVPVGGILLLIAVWLTARGESG